MKATNIQWDIDVEELYDIFDEKRAEAAAEMLEVSKETYSNMTTEERHDLIYDRWHHSPGWACDIVGLPDEIEIPKKIEDDDESYWVEDVSDWLSDEFGYCHNGFRLFDNQGREV